MSLRDEKAAERALQQKIDGNQAKLKEMVARVRDEYDVLDNFLQCVTSCNQRATDTEFSFSLTINEDRLDHPNPKIHDMRVKRYHKAIIAMRDTMVEYAERFKMYPFKFNACDVAGMPLFQGSVDANGKVEKFG